jgi:leucyl/phenylalanyl-tRNA--protein transferase
MTWAWPFRRGPRPDRDVPWIPPELGDPEGLVGVGGELSPPLLVRAYSEGVFPWFSEGDPVLWWSPDPRAVIELDGLHVSRRLARTVRSGKFRVTVDRCFEGVMRACGENRVEGTWVTGEMVAGYAALHRAGYAHSLEVWTSGSAAVPAASLGAAGTAALPGSGWELAGGIYGVAVGGLFAGESMFHRVTDASKVALVALVDRLRQRGFVLFDVQMTTEHTERMGAVNIPREDYLRRLHAAVRMTGVTFADPG